MDSFSASYSYTIAGIGTRNFGSIGGISAAAGQIHYITAAVRPASSYSSGGWTKSGEGTIEFAGTPSNTFSDMTTVAAGTLLLNKSAATAIAGDVTIGDGTTGVGGQLDVLRLKGSDQIVDSAVVALNRTGEANG